MLGWLQEPALGRAFVEEALGERGRWLAAQNPAWQFAVDAAAQHQLTEADWLTGPTPAAAFTSDKQLLADPARAARLLAEALPQEPAATQVALLGALEAWPLAASLPVDLARRLAPLLASRAKEVRQLAARWLARMADNPLLPRLWARAEPFCKSSASYSAALS